MVSQRSSSRESWPPRSKWGDKALTTPSRVGRSPTGSHSIPRQVSASRAGRCREQASPAARRVYATQTIDVAPGVRWLRMPLPFQLDHINLWLLVDGAGWTAVDTGLALPPTRERWEQLFAPGLDGKPITRVLVTHLHPDHIGNASWLTERWKADLWCTQTEWLAAEYALRSRDDADLDRRVAYYRV